MGVRCRPVADAVVGDREGERPSWTSTSTWTVVAWAWRATLDSASRRHSRRWLRVGSVTVVSIGPVMSHDGRNPSAAADSLQMARMSLRRLAASDRCWWSSKIVERIWRIDTLRSSTALGDALDDGRVVDRLGGRLQREPGGEQSLDHVVVEVAGDPLAFVEQAGGPSLLVEAGVLDGQAGRRRQPDGELLVDVGEGLAVGLVGQVEVAVDDAAEPDRHAEERRHRRVAGREPEAVGVGVQVGEPQRLGVEDQQTEDAVSFRAGADAARLLVARGRP